MLFEWICRMENCDVVIVGDGVAGITAGIFTARHERKTAIIGPDNSILRRNAHLENFPGFPAGVNSRLLLDMIRTQASRAGCGFRDGSVEMMDTTDNGFVISIDGGEELRSPKVIVATKNAIDFLEHIDDIEFIDRGKSFIETDRHGRTGIDGLYAAGRIAEKPHQAVVAAGHGAEVAVALLEDSECPFYHDWVTPDGYFTARDREVPPGCEEIDEDARQRRESESLRVTKEYFESPYPGSPEQHPSVTDK